MATLEQLSGLTTCFKAAAQAHHIFPAAAACEGAVESTWFTSEIYRRGNNLFGTKQHQHPVFGTLALPTKEFLDHHWVVIEADWIVYPTLADAFADRMATLKRLAAAYPHYAAALAANTPEDYLTQVSLSWSTGPTRGEQCIEILHAHGNLLR